MSAALHAKIARDVSDIIGRYAMRDDQIETIAIHAIRCASIHVLHESGPERIAEALYRLADEMVSTSTGRRR